MAAKKILIDLGKLKARYSGLGEMSYNFAINLVKHIEILEKDGIIVYLLVPKNFVGSFGKKVKYITLNFFLRHFPKLIPRMDLWYASHQDSGYIPGNSDCRYLMTIHDLNVAYHHNNNKAEKRLKEIQIKINRSTQLTVNSNFTKHEVIKKLNPGDKKIDVIYCGSEDFSKVESKRPDKIAADEKFFLHISTITPKKNTRALVEMMKLLPEKKLVIAGSWENDYARGIIKDIEAQNIKNIVRLSNVNNHEKAWLLQHCDALFFPSFLEGFGLPVIEAMYCGKPVFASTCTSLPEIGGDKAFYWENFEPGYMRNVVIEKMQWVENNREFSNELKTYANSFNWTKNILKYIQLFREITR